MQQKLQKFFASGKATMVVGFIGIFLISAGASWAIFSSINKNTSTTQTQTGGSKSKLNLNLPKTEACPINGLKYTKSEKNVWDARRPITAMIENHADARPLNGLSKADFIYEAVAEGGITRLMAIFYCGVAAEDVKIAPVRSVRVYFINWASEYGIKPLFTHVGGANNYCPTCPGGIKPAGTTAKEVRAIEFLETIGWRVPGGNDFDTTYDSGYPAFYRNPDRLGNGKELATEHTMIASTDELYKQAEKRGLTAKDKDGDAWTEGFVSYKFIDDKAVSSPNASTISFEFWRNKPDYDVEWKYDSKTNSYLRFVGGKADTDLSYENIQLSAKNVVVMEVDEKGPVDKEGHMFYQNIGTGKAKIFQNGTVIEATWSKADRAARTKFVDSKGVEIPFVRGMTWVEAIPSGNDINYN